MPKLQFVEKRIFDIENFQVVFRDKDGKDIRSDLMLPKQYEAERMTRNSMSVSDFKAKVKKQFPGYELDVLNGDGIPARGQTKLSTVRDTYLTSSE